MNTDDNSGSDSFDVRHKSCVELKVQPLGVVELSSLLILPPAVNTTAEIAFIYPVLENSKTIRRLKTCQARFKLKVQTDITGFLIS